MRVCLLYDNLHTASTDKIVSSATSYIVNNETNTSIFYEGQNFTSSSTFYNRKIL